MLAAPPRPTIAAEARPDIISASLFNISGVKAGWVANAGSASVTADSVSEHPSLPTKSDVATDDFGEARDYLLDPAPVSDSVFAAAEKTLRLKVTAAPKSAMAHARLGRLHLTRVPGMKDHGAKYAAASQALLELERARALLTTDADKLQLMAALVRSSCIVERYDKTRDYADEWMKKTPVASPEYGNAQHIGHTALGLIALKTRDLKGAKDHLAMSADHSGSPQLKAFGPCMDLAAALMDQGQKDAVADYLEACGRFWTMGAKQLAEWNAVLDAGNRPDFSGHFSF